MRSFQAGVLSSAYYQPESVRESFVDQLQSEYYDKHPVIWLQQKFLIGTCFCFLFVFFKVQVHTTAREFFKVYWGKKSGFNSYEADNLNHSFFLATLNSLVLADLLILSRIFPTNMCTTPLRTHCASLKVEHLKIEERCLRTCGRKRQ